MPIEIDVPLHAVSQSEFGKVAYEVVGHAFAIHKQLGRNFDESVYRSTLKHVLGPRARDEVCIKLTHSGFEKRYFVDLVVDSGCPFELKVASGLHDRHRGQLIQYLMLTGLHHGKLINFGGEQVAHEFVNCHETPAHRRSFRVNLDRWSLESSPARDFQTIILDLLHDWGTGLDTGLYREAITHLLGGPERVRCPIEALWHGDVIGKQNADLVAPSTAFQVTCLRKEVPSYDNHLYRFLTSTDLERLFWANIVSGEVTFTLLSK